jgi:hypothetical protein
MVEMQDRQEDYWVFSGVFFTLSPSYPRIAASSAEAPRQQRGRSAPGNAHCRCAGHFCGSVRGAQRAYPCRSGGGLPTTAQA